MFDFITNKIDCVMYRCSKNMIFNLSKVAFIHLNEKTLEIEVDFGNGYSEKVKFGSLEEAQKSYDDMWSTIKGSSSGRF